MWLAACLHAQGSTTVCPSQQPEWDSSSFHALHQILASLPPDTICQVRLVSRHWRAIFDKAVHQLVPGESTTSQDLLQLPNTFPSLQHLHLGKVSNPITRPVLSALCQLSSLSLLSLPHQTELPDWFDQLNSLQCSLDIALTDSSLAYCCNSLRSSSQKLAHLQLSYPSDLSKTFSLLGTFSRLQTLNIQAGILHTSPRQGRYLLDVVLLDFPVEPISTDAFSTLATLTQLTSLRLIGVNNNLDAATAAQLSSLQQLQHLAIYVESSTGISGLSGLTSLTYLCIKGQALHISDDTINAIGKLQELRSLVLEGSIIREGADAERHKLHDRLDGLACLPHLATLQFWGWLNAEAVSHMSALTQLTRLTLWESAGVTPETLRSIATLKHLEYLDLSYNKLAGAEWNPIGALTALTALHLHGCRQVTDETVQGLSTLTNLQWFDISHGVMKRNFYKDKLTEEGIWMVGALTGLRDLNLTDLTNLTDRAVLGLSSLTHLTQSCLVGAHAFLHPAQNSGLLAMKNLLSLDLSRSSCIDDMKKCELQPIFSTLTNLKQLRYGSDDFAYTLASDEPEAVEIYPSDQGKYAKLHMPV